MLQIERDAPLPPIEPHEKARLPMHEAVVHPREIALSRPLHLDDSPPPGRRDAGCISAPPPHVRARGHEFLPVVARSARLPGHPTRSKAPRQNRVKAPRTLSPSRQASCGVTPLSRSFPRTAFRFRPPSGRVSGQPLRPSHGWCCCAHILRSPVSALCAAARCPPCDVGAPECLHVPAAGRDRHNCSRIVSIEVFRTFRLAV